MKKLLLSLAALAVGLLAISAQDAKNAPAAKAAPAVDVVVKAQLPSYPLKTCPVSGEKLGAMGAPIDHVVDGHLIRLCCKGCVKKADADPKPMIAKIEAAVIREQTPLYPLETCVISGDKMGGEMGPPIDIVEGTRLVRLCCKGCKKGYAKDKAVVLAKIDAALIEKQKKDYPLKTCVISGDALDARGAPVDQLYGVQLVRLCCKGCKKAFHKDPGLYLSKVDSARKAKASKG